MQTINQITLENFDSSFDLLDILNGSVFYPAAGIDAGDTEWLSSKSNSFVHVDYSISRKDVEQAMKADFQKVGYRIIGLKSITREELTPHGFRPGNFQLNEHERERLQMPFISENFYCPNFTPFALWAIYELDETRTAKTAGKIERFSLLHIRGEACATFEALYLSNKINPHCVAIISPGEGYGDNWTLFTDPDFRLYQSLRLNHQQNNAPMPQYLLTTSFTDEGKGVKWPNYHIMWHNYIFSVSCPLCRVGLFKR
jgi:hypothetical protein